MFKSISCLAVFGWLFFGSLQAFSQADRLSEFDWTNVDPSSGQESDFVILVSGKKVFGKILRNYDKAYYAEIQFQAGGETKPFVPADLKGFGLDNGQLFFSRQLPDSSELFFVQILVSGPIELSGYRGDFFLDTGEKYQQLEAFYKNVEINNQTRRKFHKPFIVTLKTALTGECGVILYPRIDGLPYGEQAFIRLMESYYACQGTAFKVHVVKAPFLQISPTVGVGASHFSINASQKAENRNDQLENNAGYEGFVGVRFHEFRNLPRFSIDLRVGYSVFNTTVLSSYEGPHFSWTASEEIKETAVHLPLSFNYSLLKNQRSEVYFGISAGMWLKQTEQSKGMIDQRTFSSGETQLLEEEIITVMGSSFIPGVKLGYNLHLSGQTRLVMELEANSQKDYYRFSLFQNKSEYSRSRLSFQVGLEF